jgi:voltage-gated potassium channel
MMKPPHQQPALERECSEVLQQWEDWSEIPMLVLSFAWLGLFIIELVWGLTPILTAIGTTIWIAFILDFIIDLTLAPRKLFYIKHHWLIALSLMIPALCIGARCESVDKAVKAEANSGLIF